MRWKQKTRQREPKSVGDRSRGALSRIVPPTFPPALNFPMATPLDTPAARLRALLSGSLNDDPSLPEPDLDSDPPRPVNDNVPGPSSQQAGGPPGWGQTWIPHPGWQIPADHNPYKTRPKPSPPYSPLEFFEVPLRLEGMHITYVFYDCSHNFLVLITADCHRRTWCSCLIS